MSWKLFPIFLAAALAAGAAGQFFMPGAWYDTLSKPWFTPPGWVFPIAWATLYLLMSLAAARIAARPDPALPLAVWALQMVLNGLWTPVFFGAQDLGAALIIIALMWLAIAACVVTFFARDRVASAMMLPYLAWVSLASALNFEIWRLNPV